MGLRGQVLAGGRGAAGHASGPTHVGHAAASRASGHLPMGRAGSARVGAPRRRDGAPGVQLAMGHDIDDECCQPGEPDTAATVEGLTQHESQLADAVDGLDLYFSSPPPL